MSELTWDEVYDAIYTEVWKLAPQDFQEFAHRDWVFHTCVQNIMHAVQVGIDKAIAIEDDQ